MDPELRHMVEETHALTKDNHRMLRAIRRHQWYGLIGKIIIWAIVLLLPLYLFQHYFEPIVSRFSPSGSTTGTGFFGLPTTADIQKLIDSYKPK